MKNFTEFLEYEYVTETVGSGGIAYEKKVRVVVDKIEKNFSNFKRMASKGGDFSSAGSGDMTFDVGGKIINMEIKMNAKAQMGGTSINYERDEDEVFGAFPNRRIDRFEMERIEEDDREIFQKALIPMMKHMDAFIDYVKNLPDPMYKNVEGFPIKIKISDWKKLVADGLLVPLYKKIKFGAKFIRDHYQKKNVDYIQIGGIGLLHTGKDTLKLGVPMIDGEINIEMRLGAAGSGGKPTKSANYRLQGRLLTATKKSNINLDDYDSAVKGLSKYLKQRGNSSMAQSTIE